MDCSTDETINQSFLLRVQRLLKPGLKDYLLLTVASLFSLYFFFFLYSHSTETILFVIPSLLFLLLIGSGFYYHRQKLRILLQEVDSFNRTHLERARFTCKTIEVSQSGIVSTDQDGTIREFNPAAERMYGYTRAEVIGKKSDILLPEKDRMLVQQVVEEFLDDISFSELTIPLITEVMALKKNGDIFPVRVLIGFEPDMIVISVIDITREKEREEELREEKRIAEKANRTKSEFLNNVSHELRTPLHAILSFSSFGIKKAEQEKAISRRKLLDYFNNIRFSAERQLSLVNDLLDLSKLESGKMNFHFTEGDFRSLIQALELSLQGLMKEKQVSLETRIDDSVTKTSMDVARMEQVVVNLLSNAVKFSPAGKVIQILLEPVLLSLNGSDETIPGTRFIMRDQGPGIKEEEVEQLFDKFYQSEQSHPGGTGLGLAICKEIIDRHHGRLFARNHKEGGAEFGFDIPLKQETPHDL